MVTPVRPEAASAATAALNRATERLSAIVDALDRPLDKEAAGTDSRPARRCRPPRTRRRPSTRAMVARAKEYIAAGDIFQVVLSQRFEAPFPLPPFSLYRALRRVNPAPFLFFLDFGGFAVAGSSPEILVRVRDGTVTVRPIAGTRPRGETPHEDKALEEELLADPKERAEHLMLLDLGRNDVGRVAEIGTREGHRPVLRRALQPRDAHRLERRGQAGDSATTRSTRSRPAFPPARSPARRKCARWRSSTNWRRRSAASMPAAVGYFSAAGEMDTCIVLRTALVKDGTMYVQAGAGIVADSATPTPSSRNASTRRKRAVPRRRGGAPLCQRGEARAVDGVDAACRTAARLKTLNGQGNWTAHDRPDRQLRQLHLQPRPLPRRAGRGGRSCIATTRSRRADVIAARSGRDRALARPLHAERRRHLPRPRSRRRPRPSRCSASASAIRRSARRSAATWCARRCRCTASSPRSRTRARACSAASTGRSGRRAITRWSSIARRCPTRSRSPPRPTTA